jgi:excisionase family DNA binding protein
MQAPSELMTVADFCERYRIGKTSLYREAAAGRITLRKFGSATRIAREDAEAWAASLPIIAGDANATA